MKNDILYIFIDEGGNLDFSKNGTEYFILSALTKTRPFKTHGTLFSLKYDLWEKDIEFEYFHATEDTQATRDEVFQIISDNISQYNIDSIIVEKRKTVPSLQNPVRFYSKIFGILLNYILQRQKKSFSKIMVITDTLPVKKHREDIKKAIKNFFRIWAVNNGRIEYNIFHYDSKSDTNLQIVDYFNWAIYRKWSRKDVRSYNLIRKAIFSEFDVFEIGPDYFY